MLSEVNLGRALLREDNGVFDNALVGIAIMRDGRWIRVNDTFCQIFGYQPDELNNAAESLLFKGQEEFEAFRRSAHSRLAQSGVLLQDCELRRKNGSAVWCVIHGRPVDTSDTAAGNIFTVIDVSANKIATDALARLSKFLDAVVENLPTLVAVRDVKSRRYLRFNRAGESMTGRSREEVVGRIPEDVYPSDVASELLDLDLRVIQSREIIESEIVVQDSMDRQPRRFARKSVPIINEQDEVEYVMSIAEDITLRTEQERALREAEFRFREFAANISQLIFITNPARTAYDFINHRAEDVWGITIAEVQRDPSLASSLILEVDRPAIAELHAREEALLPGDAEVRIGHPIKGLRWMHIQTFPKKTADGAVRVFGMISDVTARKNEEELRLTQLVAQRDVLAREVHHRIKNNLQGVAGLLSHAARAQPALRPYLDQVATQLQSVAQVHGLRVNATEVISVQALTSAIVEQLAKFTGGSISFDMAPSNDPAAAPIALSQYTLTESEEVPIALTLNELCTNALKHGRRAASILLHSPTSDVVVIEITNDGELPVGFDFAAIQNHSSGLGLVKALLPRRGAHIRFYQRGTRVHVEITLVPPALEVVKLPPTPALQ